MDKQIKPKGKGLTKGLTTALKNSGKISKMKVPDFYKVKNPPKTK